MLLPSQGATLPEVVGLCPRTPKEFYVPHSGNCPACPEPVPLVEYVPRHELVAAIDAEHDRVVAEADAAIAGAASPSHHRSYLMGVEIGLQAAARIARTHGAS